jgi:hypothetical protein
MENSRNKTGEHAHVKILLLIIGMSLVIIVRLLESISPKHEFPLTLYVIPACLVLLLASFVSECQVRHFVTSKLATNMRDYWTNLPRFQLFRSTRVHPHEELIVARIQDLSLAESNCVIPI